MVATIGSDLIRLTVGQAYARSRGMVECGELITEERAVALDGATTARALLDLGVGDLTIGGGGRGLLDAAFAYNVPEWRPELDYAVREGVGHLSLRQPERERAGGVANGRNRWDLRFADDMPLDLGLRLGVADGKLRLGALALTALGLEIGTGNLTLDLADLAARELRIPIRAGTLNLKLIAPRDTGVRVEVRSPILTMHAKGWRRERQTWLNAAHDGAHETLHIAIDCGVASVTLQ